MPFFDREPTEGGYEPPAWSEVAARAAVAFPNLNQDELRRQYEDARMSRVAYERNRNFEPPIAHTIAEAIPFVSAVHSWRINRDGTRAQQAIAQGQGTQEDYNVREEYRRLRSHEADRTGDEELGALGRNVVSTAGEAYVGGSILKGAASGGGLLGRVPGVARALTWMGLGAEEATPIVGAQLGRAGSANTVGGLLRQTGGELVRATPRFLASTATQTAAMPSMYLPGWVENNLQHNMEANVQNQRDPLDWRGLPPAFVTGMTYVALLGSISKQTQAMVPGTGVGPTLARIGIGGPVGLLENSLIQVATGAAGLSTGYGPIGDIWEARNLTGDKQSEKLWGAWKHAALTTLTFSAFAALHEPNNPERASSAIMERFAERSRELAKQGLSKNKAGEILGEETGRMVQSYGPEAMGGNRLQPSLSDLARPVQASRPQASAPQEQVAQPQPSAQQVRSSPDPRERFYAEARSRGLSDQAANEYAERTVQEASRPTEQPMTPEQANAALATEQARIAVEGRNARPGTTQQEQPLPIQDARTGQNKPIAELGKPAAPEPVSKDAVRQAFADHVAGKISREEVNKAAKLSKREAYVFWERLDAAREGRDRTLDSIGQEPEMGVTRERVRQIEKQAISKLGLEGQTIDKLGKQLREMSKPEAKPNDGEVKRSGYEETQDSVLENKLNAVLERIGDKSLPPQEQARLFKEYERIQAAIEKGHNEANRELARAGEKPLTPEDYREIDREASRRADAARRPAAEPAGEAKSAAAEQPVPPAGFGKPLTDAERASNQLGGGQESLVGDAPKRSQTALANEITDAARAKEGKSEILREAAESNPEVWNEAMRQIDADKTLPDRLVDQVISGEKKVTTREENAILLRERVVLSNERARAVNDYLEASKLEREARKKGVDTTSLKEKMKEADGRDKALSDKVDRLDQAIVSTGSEWGRAGQFRRQLVAEDFSLGSLLNKAEKAAKRPLTTEEKSELSEASKKIKELQDRLDEAEKKLNESGDGSGSDQYPAWIVAKIKAMQAKGDVAQQIGKLEWENLSTAEKAAYVAKSYMVAAMTSGVKTLGKVGMSSLWQIGTRPAMEAVGSLWNKIPGFREVAAKADVEGRSVQPAAEVEYAKSAATQGVKDAWKTIFDGKSDLDLQYGIPRTMPRTWAEYIGNFHAAEKAPAVRAAFERAFDRVEAFEKAAGRDITSVKAMEKIGQLAYQESQRAKFQEDNLLVKKIDENISSLKKSDSLGMNALGHTIDLLMPIRKTPINILADALQYVVGVPRGIVEARIAWNKGLENLSADQANHIMRLMKKGTLGIPMLILGYWLSKSAGGYYDGRRREDELKPGEIKAGNLTIPSWATSHHPAFMALQVGAAAHRAEDREMQRHGQIDAATRAGSIASGLGHMLEEAPFLQEQREVVGLLHMNPNGMGRAARSRMIPQLIQWTAQQLDKPGTPQPQGFGQQIQMGIPGMRNDITNRRY